MTTRGFGNHRVRSMAGFTADMGVFVRQSRLRSENGAKLNSHQASAHAGQFDPNCRACNELKAKIKPKEAA